MKKTLHNKKGFTLAELLIVVAIIAVLVAIAIPIFTSQLEKAREATDLANLRAAYAECSTAALTQDNTGNAVYDSTNSSASETITLTQQKPGWTGTNAEASIGGQGLPTVAGANQSVKVTVTTAGVVTFE